MKISRSKIELFCQCPRCFVLDRKYKCTPPSGPPFTLNNAVDALWKCEFDKYRELGEPHPLMVKHGINAIPYQHEKMGEWRNNFKGITFFHEATQFTITGAPDEVWVTPTGELIVVDVKATSKSSEINLDADWQMGYKRQMEVYQWLFRQNGFKVLSKGYFVYCNGKGDRDSSGTQLKFDISVLEYVGSDVWIEPALFEIKNTLTSDLIPESGDDCKLCKYQKQVRSVTDNLASSLVNI